MDKQEVYRLLEQEGIWHEITEHGAVYNMEELEASALPYPGASAKNLFIRDDKKQNYYLITVRGDKSVPLKQFKESQHTRRLTFAAEEDMEQLLGLHPGSVTPLGLLNDTEKKVTFYADRAFLKKKIIGVHPNDNTATVWFHPQDLFDLIEKSGHPVHYFSLD